MNERKRVIWFWQRIVSPHMAGLAAALSRQGCDVVYVAERLMTKERVSQGWLLPDLGSARLELASTISEVQAQVKAAPADSIHICQGIRANGLIGEAQKTLAQYKLRQWVVMETLDDSGWCGMLKRLEYRRQFLQWRRHIEGVLAIGHSTVAWVQARGMSAEKIFPFAYFLPDVALTIEQASLRPELFRFVFVGQFIKRKRLDILIDTLALLKRNDFELVVIGTGPLEREWRASVEAVLPNQVHWIGRLPMHEVSQHIEQADCLVLPSRYDGWGAVVSEALMVGTPAICSDRCGSAGVIRASGFGGVFQSGNPAALTEQLVRVLGRGRLTGVERHELANWGRSLGSEAGAAYLDLVLSHVEGHQTRPSSPWIAEILRN